MEVAFQDLPRGAQQRRSLHLHVVAVPGDLHLDVDAALRVQDGDRVGPGGQLAPVGDSAGQGEGGGDSDRPGDYTDISPLLINASLIALLIDIARRRGLLASWFKRRDRTPAMERSAA